LLQVVCGHLPDTNLGSSMGAAQDVSEISGVDGFLQRFEGPEVVFLSGGGKTFIRRGQLPWADLLGAEEVSSQSRRQLHC